jgi:hypothetical protein
MAAKSQSLRTTRSPHDSSAQSHDAGLSILTVASWMQHLLLGSDELEARKFHDRCLQHLIPALSRSADQYDENLLATVTLLKYYEEIDLAAYPKTHSLVSHRLLNAVPKFSWSGGLAEASSWQLLRAAIYESMVEGYPWRICLENYDKSQASRKTEDTSYANVMVHLVARLLSFLSS